MPARPPAGRTGIGVLRVLLRVHKSGTPGAQTADQSLEPPSLQGSQSGRTGSIVPPRRPRVFVQLCPACTVVATGDFTDRLRQRCPIWQAPRYGTRPSVPQNSSGNMASRAGVAWFMRTVEVISALHAIRHTKDLWRRRATPAAVSSSGHCGPRARRWVPARAGRLGPPASLRCSSSDLPGLGPRANHPQRVYGPSTIIRSPRTHVEPSGRQCSRLCANHVGGIQGRAAGRFRRGAPVVRRRPQQISAFVDAGRPEGTDEVRRGAPPVALAMVDSYTTILSAPTRPPWSQEGQGR